MRRQPRRQRSVDALTDLLGELKGAGIFRAFSVGERLSGFSLCAQERPRPMQKLFAVLGRLGDFETYLGNDLADLAAAALGTRGRIPFVGRSKDKYLANCSTVSAEKFK